MNNVRLRILQGMVMAVTLNVSCDDEDPCKRRPQRTADFRMYSNFYYYEKVKGKVAEVNEIVEEDIFMLGNQITFEAFDSTATSYEWKIRSDPNIRMEKKLSLYFTNSAILEESPITVQLKVTKQPDGCFPETFVDSVQHVIHFLHPGDWPVLGKYTGFDNTNPEEIFTIEILREKTAIYPDTAFLIRNLPNACNNKDALLFYPSAFQFSIDMFDHPDLGTNHQCVFRQYDKKVGKLLPDRKTLVIEYGFTDHKEQDASLQTRTFIGTRQ